MLAGKLPDRRRARGVLARSTRSPSNRSRFPPFAGSSDRPESPKFGDDRSPCLDRKLSLTNTRERGTGRATYLWG